MSLPHCSGYSFTALISFLGVCIGPLLLPNFDNLHFLIILNKSIAMALRKIKSLGDIKLTKVKVEAMSRNCQCCLSDKNLKSIFEESCFMGKSGKYADMIKDCFSIEVESDNMFLEEFLLICEVCISKLTECCVFRNQIIKTRDQLNKIRKTSLQQPVNNTSPYIDDHKVVEIKMENVSMWEDDDSDWFLSNDLTEDKLNIEMVGSPDDTGFSVSKKTTRDLKQTKKRTNFKKYSKDVIPIQDSAGTEILEKKLKKEVKPKVKRRYAGSGVANQLQVDKNALTCPVCNESFMYHRFLIAHLTVHYPNYVCPTCGKAFLNKKNLNTHIKWHENLQETCKICNITMHKYSMSRHMKYKHLKVVDFQKCLHCPEGFPSFYQRNTHMLAVHGIEPPRYYCKICPKNFRQSSGLTEHMANAHLLKNKYICDLCGRSFFGRTQIVEHMRRHTGARPFPCTICKKNYSKAFVLKEHMKIHLNIRDYKCEICGKTFVQKCSLKGHMKTHENHHSGV